MFIDESGRDRRESPYEVLAGVAVADPDLWNLICAVHALEERVFGRRYSVGENELKAKRLLKAKTFRQATSRPEFDLEERRHLAKRCLDDGLSAGPDEIAALAQAKLAFVADVLALCGRFRCKAFASIVDRDAPGSTTGFLRKDYSYLFERFYYFLEDHPGEPQGIVVFDELERSSSHLLVDQMARYFRETGTGRLRAGRVVPEPFFVHSDLTTGVQLADLIAYLISWNVRVGNMTRPARGELREFGDSVLALRQRTERERGANPRFVIWSFAVIDDLRSRDERE